MNSQELMAVIQHELDKWTQLPDGDKLPLAFVLTSAIKCAEAIQNAPQDGMELDGLDFNDYEMPETVELDGPKNRKSRSNAKT